ncbi:hypothetical protein QNO09_38820 [Streptomyces sp. 378]|uniref:hypothetical protein n=1 Tax=Streptomyces sp. 378 TaxID=3049412 RepID=UPI0024C37D8A|nr:hypothetical protein [Streptomyces sp. 378]MDK1349098.1 hypothetical protein [Streptomyces sp. 378]
MTSLRIGLIPARDPEGFDQLEAMVESATWSSKVGRDALHSLVKIVAARGGTLADITVGDAVEYLAALKAANAKTRGNTLFYAWLRELGTLPAEAPSSLRYLANTSGQVSMEQLVDRFGVRCRPVRDLLVDYLKERQPGLDYTSLRSCCLSGRDRCVSAGRG